MLINATRRRSLLALTGATAGLATAVLAPSAALAAPADSSDVTVELGEPIVIQGGCGTIKNVTVYNNGRTAAKAHWELTCGNGQITMSGWVDDTLADGKCAYLTAYWGSGFTEIAKDCPADGPREEFKWTHPGTLVDGYLGVR